MNEQYEDPLARLEAILLDWDYSFHESQQRMATRLAHAKSRLEVAWSDAESTKAALDAVLGGATSSMTSVQAETAPSPETGDVRKLEASLERCYSRIRELERERVELLIQREERDRAKATLEHAIRALEQELTAFRTQPQAVPAEGEERRDIAAPLVLADSGRDTVSRAVEDVPEEFQARLREIVAENERANAALAQRLAEALRDREEAHQQIVHLRGEVESLQKLTQSTSSTAWQDATGLSTLDFNESAMKRLRLGQILESRGIVTRSQLDEALETKKRAPQKPLGAILVEMGATDEETIAKILASQLNLPYVELDRRAVDPAAAALIPAKLARHHLCIPIAVERGQLVVAMANPMDLVALEDLELATRRRVDPVIATPAAIEQAIAEHFTAI